MRDLDLAQSPLVRTLFGIRTLPDQLKGKKTELRLRLDDLVSTPEEPGFQILAAVRLTSSPSEPLAKSGGLSFHSRTLQTRRHLPRSHNPVVKVAWALRVALEGDQTSRVELELRVAATDEDAWTKFKRYMLLGIKDRAERMAGKWSAVASRFRRPNADAYNAQPAVGSAAPVISQATKAPLP